MLVTAKLVTAPTEEPISLQDAIGHLKLEDGNEDDGDVSTKIAAARAMCERSARVAFCTQTWDLFYDYFPGQDPQDKRRNYDVSTYQAARLYGNARRRDEIMLRFPPTQEVTFVKYVDVNGTWQTLDPALYFVDLASSRIRLKPGAAWPQAMDVPGAVNIRVVAGYGTAADVPADAKMSILVTLGHIHENREAQDIPQFAETLLSPFRDYNF